MSIFLGFPKLFLQVNRIELGGISCYILLQLCSAPRHFWVREVAIAFVHGIELNCRRWQCSPSSASPFVGLGLQQCDRLFARSLALFLRRLHLDQCGALIFAMAAFASSKSRMFFSTL
jgi:hypothetical protein